MFKRLREKLSSAPLTAKVSVSYTVCSVIQRCIGLITIPLFTRLLTKYQYGQATVYGSWLSLLMILLTLQLPYGSLSKAMIKYEDRRDEYLSSVEGICLLLSAFFLLIYLPFSDTWNKLFKLPTFIIVLMVFEILSTTGIALWSGKKRFEYRYKEVVFVTLLMAVASPLVQFFLITVTEEKGYALITGNAFVSILIGGGVFCLLICKGKNLYNKEFWKYAFSFNVPLLIYYLSQMIFNTSDRIMITHICGEDKAAVYGVAYNLGFMLNFVLTAIANSYVPWFYEKLKINKQSDNIKISALLASLMSVLLLGIIWLAPEIVLILGGKEYLEAVYVVPPVAVSVLLLFYAQLSINYEFYYEKKTSLVCSSIIAAIVNIVLNALLIPKCGFGIAAYTTMSSYVLFALQNYFTMRRIEKEKNLDKGINAKWLLIIFVFFILIDVVGIMLYDFPAVRYCVAVMASFACIYVLFNRSYFVTKYKILLQEKSVDEHYSKVLNNIRNRSDRKVRFAAYVMYDSSYGFDDVFRMMLSSKDKWIPKIVIIPDVLRGYDNALKTYNKTRKYMAELYGEDYILDGWDGKEGYYDLSEDFDLILFCNPYDVLTHEFHSIKYLAYKNVLTMYETYGYEVSSYYTKNRQKGCEINLLWRCYTDTVYSYDDYCKFETRKGRNVKLIGYSKMDPLYKQLSVNNPSDRKKILISPHHTVSDKNLPMSNFTRFSELFLKLPDMFPDVDFIFRPHPLLFVNLVKSGVWTQEQVDSYLGRLNNKKIIYSTEANYFHIFSEADAMINDSGSFTVEWLYTGKPGCFMYNPELKHSQLTALMNKALTEYTIAKCEDDIIRFIKSVLDDTSDKKYKMKEWVKDNIAINYPNVSKAIIDDLEDLLFDKANKWEE